MSRVDSLGEAVEGLNIWGKKRGRAGQGRM